MGSISRVAIFLLGLAVCLVPQVAFSQSKNTFGAIAYSTQTGAHGYSHNYPSRRAAERAAVANCRNYGGRNCAVTVWFDRRCGALATGSKKGWGSAQHQNKQRANSEAVRFCRQHDRNCKIVASVCSF